MPFLKFPYTDAHQLNLDWIIKKVQNIPAEISRIISDLGLVNAQQAAAAAPVQSVNGQTGNVIVGGAVDSVNGQTGAVVLDADDVGALPDSTKYAGAAVAGGAADKTQRIFYGAVDATSTATAFTAQIPGLTELINGVVVMLKNGVVSSASGCTLNINNLGAKPMYSSMQQASAITTIFNINYTFLMVYDEDRTAGGCWLVYYGYYADKNDTAYIIRTLETTLPVTGTTYRYKLLFSSPDDAHYVPANTSTSTSATTAKTVNQDPIDPFGPIRYYGTTTAVSANNRPNKTYLFDQNVLILGYSFNVAGNETLTAYKPVYLKCAPQNNGSAIMDSTTPIVQDLPNSEDGKIYILLGVAYDTTHMELIPEHPVYFYKSGSIRLWTNSEAGSGALPQVGFISLSSSWTGSSSPYTQTVTVTGATVTNNSKVDLQPDASAIAQMISDSCVALFIKNNNGTLTAYAIGSAPTTALTIQATVTEVTV